MTIERKAMTGGNDELDVRDLMPNIGSEIRVDKKTLLSGKYAKQIRDLLERRGVLVFSRVGLTDEEQCAFTQSLGTQAYEYNGLPQQGGTLQPIFKVSLDKNVNPLAAEGLKSSFFWHLDGSTHEIPILASLLSPAKLSPTGGQTEFCNTYAAYESLSDEDKKAIEGLKVVHANWARDSYVDPEPSYERFKSVMSVPSREQPLVWKHRSGRKSLVIGLTAAYVVGLDPLESRALLIRLRDLATQPQFVYHHEWTMGDLVMWDNTGTLHRALPYDPKCGRLMIRTMLAGEEAFA
jgi:alpha-ketoglutarate-dependent taurine dioxygenase